MKEEKKYIYLDHAATTATRPEVVEAMLPYFTEYYGNPSSIYSMSGEPRRAIAAARSTVAKALGVSDKEIYFTNGGSESDNWVLIAAAEAGARRLAEGGKELLTAAKREKDIAPGKHIITTKIEHHAILHTCEYLQERGFEVTYLDVDSRGLVSPEALEAAIRPDTVLISVMAANNEIGTIQPLAAIGAIAKKYGILFHTDAVQAFAHMDLPVRDLGVDLLSASAHKFGGPRGAGFLYIRRGVRLRSFIHGGAQERGRRAGTENTPGIVGLGKAAELAMGALEENTQKERELRDYLVSRVLAKIPDAQLNGPAVPDEEGLRLANNANFSFRGVDGESLLIMLDMEGICASGGSACAAGSLEPSHVLLAIGLPEVLAQGAVRMTVGPENTMEEIDRAVEVLTASVGKIRERNGYRG
ncbi:MAG: aminotransferase class V-fold PLP-dependent enzyme [Clostridium sp.]|nr:aminotransferase class V-fold PLP-dependent enzyme [Clostridium sp.]